MASALTSFRPAVVRASASSSNKPDPNIRKPASANWWAPLFGWSSDADYIDPNAGAPSSNETGVSDTESGRLRSRFALGGFTEEKAKQLRRKTMESSAFHDIMYHSSIASRLASDISDSSEK
ncbi:hypothetical protein I3843_01G235000 [Carya illinoinensis]|uniref:Uncharacterized protein n=1 Tax=Carya illinoinensis TaxID=32201 RepID=A0A8T1RR66_CARIL|nr:uncharacterized protein LOC122300971 [Carya illinoinensis]KAG2729246.1 hypothetical protein I3760_01G240300 [Carya illinoinensis]KAG6669424.1 hypothetical protein CIPAW_01G243500 [Carya illinoinensis]KAG6733881.1 hypothetical protein I3842_01G244700 [Carya illinoinensis]KAG7997977.1 hypothetical protein I3843_01G235000 [Carya illinoinensis]